MLYLLGNQTDIEGAGDMIQVGDAVHCTVMYSGNSGRRMIDTVHGIVKAIENGRFVVETPAVKCELYYSIGQEGKTIFLDQKAAKRVEDDMQARFTQEDRENSLKQDDFTQ